MKFIKFLYLCIQAVEAWSFILNDNIEIHNDRQLHVGHLVNLHVIVQDPHHHLLT